MGRTTFYRHFSGKGGKEELLRFKLLYEWDRYRENRSEEFGNDKVFTLLNFIYENKKLFNLLNEGGILQVSVCLFENLVGRDYADDKASSYLKSFMVYGNYGAVYQWIKYGFDETPSEVCGHVMQTVIKSLEDKK